MSDGQASGETLQIASHLYRVGQPAAGVVLKAAADALLVELPGHIRGLIQHVSLPPELRDKKCDQIVSKGAEVEAVVQRIDREKHLVLLSGLKIVRDPWEETRPRLKPGALVRGAVYNIEEFGVFVELDQGISALIPVSGIPGGIRGNLGKMLALGDLVEARVCDINDKKREIAASIQAQLDALRDFRKNAKGKWEQEAELVETLLEKVNPVEKQSRPQLQGSKGKVRRILFVDDDPDFLDLYGDWLKKAGYEVEAATTGDAGVERGVTEGYDLILMDVNLPDIDGIEATRRILKERPDSQIAIVTADDEFDSSKIPAEVKLVGVVSKWEGFPGIEGLIIRLETGASYAPITAYQAISREAELLQRVSQRESCRRDLRETLKRIVDDLLEATGAQTGIIFDMHPDTGKVSSLVLSGVLPDQDYDVAKLRYSPVRDVIHTGAPIYENRALDSGERFRYLLRYLMFDSCIGLRIEVEAEPVHRYALFLFHYRADQFTDTHFQQALLVSKMMGLAIERHIMDEREQELQGFAVAGLLSSGLLHEIRHRLGQIEVSWRNVQLDCRALWSDPQATGDDVFFRNVEQSTARVMEASRGLWETADSYLGLLRSQQQQLLDVNEMLERSRRVIAAEIGRDILVKVRPGKDLPKTFGVASRLERAFVNVMLNAVQQMKEHSTDGGVLLTVAFCDAKDTTRPIKVRFIDTGPGIHRKDFERIFKRGVSSRKGGSGLGLYITRGLIEAMGGRVRVEDSRMYIGSCFLVELPAATKEVSDGRISA